MNVSRREVLVGAGALAGCFVLGGAGVAFASGDSCIRPPGGQDEARLRALCLKCDRCRSACPQNIIVSIEPEDSLFDARMPKLDFHLGYCDYCGLCQKVCPTQALRSDFSPDKDALGTAQLDPSLCLAYSSLCEKCKDSCPYGALTFNEQNHPVVDALLCNGCGRCVDVCQSNIASSYSGGGRALEVCATGRG